MCQLLGLSANQPVCARSSLGGFLLRGGVTDQHRDGWGLGFYRDDECLVLTDDRPAAHSPLADEVLGQSIRASNLIAHVRRATQGAVALNNCHPFQRQLWGRNWLFAHNGDLKRDWEVQPGPYAAHGETDSELAFCSMLNALTERFGDVAPTRGPFAAALADITDDLARCGAFNFVMTDGEALFARCSTELHHVQRRFPFGCAQLVDSGADIDFSQHNHPDDQVTVIATRPLTRHETWVAFAPGELKVFIGGEEWRDDAAPARESVSVHAPADEPQTEPIA